MALYAAVADGKDVYCQFFGYSGSNNTTSGITKVDSYGQSRVLVSGEEWFAYANTEKLVSYYSFSVYDDNLYFTDTGTDMFYSVDKNSGVISTLASPDNIGAVTGKIDVQLLAFGGESKGYMYIYEGKSDSIIRAGVDGVSTVISSSGLLSLTGNTMVSGGLAFDNNDNMYWYGGTSPSIYAWNINNGTGREVLSSSDIEAITGESSVVGMGHIYFAPDGNMYFLDRNRGIMSFDPENPEETLSMVITKADLINGPAGSSTLYNFTWYNDSLAFCQMNTGFFAVVPEPLTVLTLASGGLVVIRRIKSVKN